MTKLHSLLSVCAGFLFFAASWHAKGTDRKVQVSDFGKTGEGISLYPYVLANNKGGEAVVISHGATLVSLKVPGRSTEENARCA